MITLGTTIREAREQKKLSLRALARLLTLSPAYVSDIELDRRVPAEDTLRAIASTLDLDFGDLFELTGRLGEKAEQYLKGNAAARSFVRGMAAQGPDDRAVRLMEFMMYAILKKMVADGDITLPEGADG